MADPVLPKSRLKPADIDQRIDSLKADNDRLYKSLDKPISREAKIAVNQRIVDNRADIAAYQSQLRSMNITGADEIERKVTNMLRKK